MLQGINRFKHACPTDCALEHQARSTPSCDAASLRWPVSRLPSIALRDQLMAFIEYFNLTIP